MTCIPVDAQLKTNHTVESTHQLMVVILWGGFFLFTVAFNRSGTSAVDPGMPNWLYAKKQNAISCGSTTNVYAQLNNTHQEEKNNHSDNKNNGNGCSHQFATGTLCNTDNLKRRSMKANSC